MPDKQTLAYVVAGAMIVFGCSRDAQEYPSPEGKPTPYILKNDCEFSIVDELSRSSITSPQATGAPGSWASASISLGDYSITVSNCEVVENPAGLPIYQE